ncbi:FecR family protein [Sphingobacterium sp. ML3W]|uniref:FecR family protein n=1 Tax=Sphingobacterium sp. ML3W TaxID=1538644 RepID=UPI00249A5FE5|nr:FecR family protein [Sphingobacterium sp. ML3W]WFA81027.1 FecR family protein [Sphingobacterium sp. ML3W]
MEVEDYLKDNQFIKWVNESNEDRSNYWSEWLANNPQDEDNMLRAKAIVESLNKFYQPTNQIIDLKDQIWQQIESTVSSQSYHPKRIISSLWYKWTAAIVFFILFYGSLLYINNRDRKSINLESESGYNVYVNKGKISKIIFLPDGTKASLEPGAVLKRKTLFNDKIRKVSVIGRIFFDVAKDSTRRFVVETPFFNVKVVGTSFWVLADKHTEKQQVAVKSGKVEVGSIQEIESKPYTLLPSERLTLNSSTGRFVKDKFQNESTYTTPQMANDILVFRNVSLSYVLDSLSSMYDIKIRFDRDQLNQCKATLPLPKGSIYDKLFIISRTTGLRYQIEEQTIVVDGTCSGSREEIK